jgi:hypothetical protein
VYRDQDCVFVLAGLLHLLFFRYILLSMDFATSVIPGTLPYSLLILLGCCVSGFAMVNTLLIMRKVSNLRHILHIAY